MSTGRIQPVTYISFHKGHTSIIECLLNNGANADLCVKKGRSPLYMSCFKGFENILLNNDANVNVGDQSGSSPLYLACQNDKNNITAQVLLNNGANVDSCYNKDRSP